jgi:KaiC/GvpD/RAD55 family RecA-like ATPase
MRPLVIRIAPTEKEVEAALSQPLPRVVPLAGDTAEDELHAIVLRLLGLDRQVALFEVLRNDPSLNAVLKDAATAVKEKRYGLAALEFERLMRAILLPKNVAAIADDLGKDAERRLYKSLVVRFVPFLGWTYFVTLLLAAVYYNRDATAPMFR